MRNTFKYRSHAEDDSVGQPERAAEEAVVKRELDELRGFAAALSVDDLRGGDWFAKLLTFSLTRYVQEVDAEYFRRKYPNLPADAIVQARIKLAARYAGIEGGITASAYTAAVAATIGSLGGASPLAVPAGAATFAVDLTYVSQLQLRLAYDIAVLYRVPLNLDDPEDLWKLIRIAFGIKAGELSSSAALKGVPAVVRPLIKKIFSGATLTSVKSLPVVGKHLLQRNIIKFAIPAVGVPITVATNYWLTKIAGDHAASIFRTESRIIESARRIVEKSSDHDTLLWVTWFVIRANDAIHENQRLLLHHVSSIVREEDPELTALNELRDVIEVEEEVVWGKVQATTSGKDHLYQAAGVAAAVDGRVSGGEREILRELAGLCSETYDETALRTAAKGWS